MPIKEIVGIAIAAAIGIIIQGGPLHAKDNLRKAAFKIYAETSRTDNWGNPSPWSHQTKVSKPNKFRAK